MWPDLGLRATKRVERMKGCKLSATGKCYKVSLVTVGRPADAGSNNENYFKSFGERKFLTVDFINNVNVNI